MSQSHILGLLARAGGKNIPIFIPWPAAHLAATGEPRAGERAEGQRLLRARPAEGGGGCCARSAEGRRLQSCCGRCGTGGRETSDKYDCCSVVVQGGRWLPENMATNVNGEHLVFDF